ncbi:MAG: phosphoglucomutase (alpha-D-glucose-1,6-bisphosphate-dependent) [Planctomycetaceae bacterium]|jgi:phosphoglucomutase|nr:phosphoglucomutase (alpha-D-glucose-1,6-bisphosphate-dependent) [Planctomycetaceae bacterium]
MTIHFLAGQPAPESILIDTSLLERSYFENIPDTKLPEQRVIFGTSGHRGTSAEVSFTESHILAIVQAICDYRNGKGYTGPLFLGKDTHFLSRQAERNAIEVLAANDVQVYYQSDDGFTPTPVISWSILKHNHLLDSGFADGIVITPSHNPPSDGGIKYNPPNGGPADTDVTSWIQDRANAYLSARLSGVKRLTFDTAISRSVIKAVDFAEKYIADLDNIIDMKLISESRIKIGVDPLGGAGVAYWDRIAERYKLDITVVNRSIDPRFSFMTVDHDGKIRMDCSSQYAMRRLVDLKNNFDIAFANDPDTDRHGIVVPDLGLMNPNHYLSAAIQYLFTNRPKWSGSIGIGKTLVSSAMIDRIADSLNVKLVETPVGFKWFVEGLFSGTLGFCGEESAGASFLCFDGRTWSTDKDGIILNLLAAEIIAKTEKSPGIIYRELESRFGKSFYTRIDQPTTPQQKAAFKGLSVNQVRTSKLAGDEITFKLTKAPGNGALIGGLKVVSGKGWFAVRPSGTENIYKIYAESFCDEEHLNQIISEAKEIVDSIRIVQ